MIFEIYCDRDKFNDFEQIPSNYNLCHYEQKPKKYIILFHLFVCGKEGQV